MLNWRRDPVVEMQTERSEQRTKQLEKEIALLDWMLSEMDLIKAGLPSSSTPPQTTAANSNNY
jgi:hypothetical protein